MCRHFETTVSPEPLPSFGSGETGATFSAPEMASAGAARGVSAGRSAGTFLAKSPELEKSLNSKLVFSAAIMRGSIELAISDLQKCRRFDWISEEMRAQLGRCLFELTEARKMAL